MPNNRFDTLDFESKIYESTNEHDEWGPGGYVNPNPADVDTVLTVGDGRVQNPGILVPGVMRRTTPPDQLLQFDKGVPLMAADAANFLYFDLDNTKVTQILPADPYRKSAQINYSLLVKAMLLGRQAQLEALIGLTTIASTHGVPAWILNPASSSLPMVPFVYESKSPLYAICLTAAGLAQGIINIEVETFNGDLQIG